MESHFRRLRRLAIPRADLLTDVAAEDMVPHARRELGGDLALVLYAEIADAAAGIEHVGLREGLGRTVFQAGAAASAAIRDRFGCDAQGRLTALKSRIVGDSGAYASVGMKVLERAAGHACGPYRVPAVDIESIAAYTNNPPCGAMRGFGVNQAHFALDGALDWDTVDSARYAIFRKSNQMVERLQQRHADRIAKNPEFRFLIERLALVQEFSQRKTTQVR